MLQYFRLRFIFSELGYYNKNPKIGVINSVNKEGMGRCAELFLEALFYQSKSQWEGRSTVREAEFLFLDV